MNSQCRLVLALNPLSRIFLTASIVLNVSLAGAQETVLRPAKEKIATKRRRPASAGEAMNNLPVKKKTLKHCAFPGGSVTIRFVHSQRDYGRFQDIVTLPVWGEFSFYLSNLFVSTPGKSRSEFDMDKISGGLQLYTPHLGGFGALAWYADASGTYNSYLRGGVYHSWIFKTSWLSGGLITSLFPVKEPGIELYFRTIWSMTFAKLINFSGSSSYTLAHRTDVSAVRPQLGINIVDGFRAVVAYDFNDSRVKEKGAVEPGIEFFASF